MKHIILLQLLLSTCLCFSQNAINKTGNFFIENKGQIIDQNNEINPEVLYLFNSDAFATQLRKSGFSYEIIKRDPDLNSFQTHRVDIDFIGSSEKATIEPYGIQEVFLRYVKNNLSPLSDKIHMYTEITYKNVYPNIDIHYRKDPLSGYLKYDFVLKPGAKISDIQLQFRGYSNLYVSDDLLFIELSNGTIKESIPVSFEEASGKKLDVKYLINYGNGKEATVSFNANGIDLITAKTIIDPVPQMSWARYIGDSLYTETKGVITDRFGHIYICGSTQSLNNIATSGAYQDTIADSLLNDAYLSKYLRNGNLAWSTYFGGESIDIAHDVYVDTTFNVFLAGTTYSLTGIADSSGHQDTLGGAGDAFIAKFDKNGEFLWASYFGGDSLDSGIKLSVDYPGNVYLTGTTFSQDAISGDSSYQPMLLGESDAFVVKFDSAGILQWSSYLGGTSADIALGLSFGDTSLFIVGQTYSVDFPVGDSVLQDSLLGLSDGFISKFTQNGELEWSTYYGGEKDDALNSVKTLNNNVYIIGTTDSDSNIVTGSAFQMDKKDSTDAFIVKMDRHGQRIWSSYFGGDSIDIGTDLFFELDSNLFIFGSTNSDSLPGVDSSSYQIQLNGMRDTYISKISKDGELLWSTYYGGENNEESEAIGVYGNSAIYVVGSTNSDSIVVPELYQITSNIYNSDLEGFFTKFLQEKSTIPSGIGGTSGGGGSGVPCDTCETEDYTYEFNWNCPGDTFYISVEGGELGTDAEWIWYENQCGDSQVIGTGETIVVYPMETTTYYVRAESITNATECVHTTIVIAPITNLQIISDSIYCRGNDLVLECNSPGSGNWSGPNQFTSDSLYTLIQQVDDSLEGWYFLDFTDIYGCPYTDSLEISFADKPVFISESEPVMCFGDSSGAIFLAGDNIGSHELSWENGLSGDTLTGLPAGLYIVSVTDSLGCMSTDSIEVISPSSAFIDAEVFPTACSDSTGIIILNLNDSLAPISAFWSPIVQESDSAINLCYGNHTVTLIYGEKCQETFDFFVPNENLLEVSIVDFTPVACPDHTNGIAAAEVYFGSPPYVFSWTESSVTDSIVTDLDTGQCIVTVLDASGCYAYDTVLIESLNSLNLDTLSQSSLCTASTGEIVLELSDTTVLNSIIWSTGNSGVYYQENLSPGVYEVTLSDTAGCSYHYFWNIGVINDLSISFSQTEIVINEGDSVQLAALINSNGNYSWQWSPPIDLSCTDCANPFASPSTDTSYLLEVSDTLGCYDSVSVNIHIIHPCIEVFIPSIFSPNNDGLNEDWKVIGTCIKMTHLKVYNQWGDLIFEGSDQNAVWNGTHQGEMVPADQYTFIISVEYEDETSEQFSGSVCVIY